MLFTKNQRNQLSTDIQLVHQLVEKYNLLSRSYEETKHTPEYLHFITTVERIVNQAKKYKQTHDMFPELSETYRQEIMDTKDEVLIHYHAEEEKIGNNIMTLIEQLEVVVAKVKQ